MFIFQNYTKRLSLTTYDNGIAWKLLTGFDQVVMNGIPTYYTVDFDYAINRVVTFDQYWNYQNYSSLPFAATYTTKYVNGYFYFTADSYFYKTDMTFKTASNYYRSSNVFYRQMYYDSTSSKFYVAPCGLQVIQVFDTNCSLVHNISLGNNYPYGLNYFNGSFYIGTKSGNQILVLKNGIITDQFHVTLCSIASLWGVISITFDSYGYMAITCFTDNRIVLTDSNGINYNKFLYTSSRPYISQIDATGRFVLMTSQSLDIYY